MKHMDYNESKGSIMATMFDTHAAIKELKKAGFSEKQAEGVTSTFIKAQTLNIEHLATKSDLRDTRVTLEARMHVLQWMCGTIVAGVVAIGSGVVTIILKLFF